MALPVNKCIVQRLDSTALGYGTMVFRIRESVAEHNIVLELLRVLRHDYPGVWYCFQQELLKERQALEDAKPIEKVKAYIEVPLTNDERIEEES